jgi:hypothetical protein
MWVWSYDPNETVEDLKKAALEGHWAPEFRSCYEHLPVHYLVHEQLPDGATIRYCDTRGHLMEKHDERVLCQNDCWPR